MVVTRRKSSGLYHAIGFGRLFDRHPKDWSEDCSRPSHVLAKAKTSATWAFFFLDPAAIFDQTLIVFALDDYASFALLQSSVHEAWAIKFSTSHKTDLRYTPSMVFDTFPRCRYSKALDTVGREYYEARNELMARSGEGLTKIYTWFDDPHETGTTIARLRAARCQLDAAVVAEYWTRLDLGHGFHETKQGVRFTISEKARSDILARLLELNHERYREEVGQGLHDRERARARPADEQEADDE